MSVLPGQGEDRRMILSSFEIGSIKQQFGAIRAVNGFFFRLQQDRIVGLVSPERSGHSIHRTRTARDDQTIQRESYVLLGGLPLLCAC